MNTRKNAPTNPTRTIALFVYDGVQLLDVAGPCDVFHEANRQSGRALYKTEIVGLSPEPVMTSSAVQLVPTVALRRMPKVHTFLIAGAPGVESLSWTPAQLRAVQEAASKSNRYGSICTGAFVMAQTSLMDRKRVTTHWAFAPRFTELYPQVELQAEKMFVKHGRLVSSAGVSAGIDLCLALVEEDHGVELAMRVSRHLVMALRRPGGQMQFSKKEEMTPSGRTVFEILHKKISKRLREDLRVEVLAHEVQLSVRHLTRLFRHELKTSPAKWVEDLRLAAVKEYLEETSNASKAVAFDCGFSSDNSLRRAFLRRYGITPSQYRRPFSIER